MFVLSLALFVFNLALTHRIRPYNSDDVAYQNILTTWHPFSGTIASLGSSDNFVDKLPFFALLNHLISNSRKALFIESVLMAVTGFTLFYGAAIYFMRKARIALSYLNLLPFIWLASFGHAFSQLYLNPAWRGFEVGAYFLIFALVASYCYGTISPFRSTRNKLLTLLALLLTGVLTYSDPYSIYFVFGPLAVFTLYLAYRKFITRNQLYILYAFLFFNFVFAKLTSVVTHAAGIRMATSYPIQFVAFDNIGSSIMQTLHSILILFGADPFGRSPFSGSAVSAMLNLFLIGYIFFTTYSLFRRVRSGGHAQSLIEPSWRLFFGLVGSLVALLYAFSTVADGVNTYRYFIMLALTGTLLIALTLGSSALSSDGKKALAVVLAFATLLNIGVAIRDPNVFPMPGATNNNRNVVNFDIIHTLQENGLEKGYANYWQAGINTYLSNDQINALPAYCLDNGVSEFHWLIDESRFEQHATKSFYLYDPLLPQTANCSQDNVISQFGKPDKTLVIDGKTLLIYSYDITAKMH
jgi:hypothetical protein